MRGKNISRIGFFLSVTGLLMIGLYFSETGSHTGFYDLNAIFSDWTDAVAMACNPNAYKDQGFLYPPSLAILLKIIGKITIPTCEIRYSEFHNIKLYSAGFGAAFMLSATCISCFLYIKNLSRHTGAIIEQNCIILAFSTLILSPPVAFGIGRLSTSLLVIPLLIIAAGFELQQKPTLANIFLISTSMVKPFFILYWLIYITIEPTRGLKKKIKHSIISAFVILSIIIVSLVIGQYHGGIEAWIRNIFDFRELTKVSWDFNYYSFSNSSAGLVQKLAEYISNESSSAIRPLWLETVNAYRALSGIAIVAITVCYLYQTYVFASIKLKLKPAKITKITNESSEGKSDAYPSYIIISILLTSSILSVVQSSGLYALCGVGVCLAHSQLRRDPRTFIYTLIWFLGATIGVGPWTQKFISMIFYSIIMIFLTNQEYGLLPINNDQINSPKPIRENERA